MRPSEAGLRLGSEIGLGSEIELWFGFELEVKLDKGAEPNLSPDPNLGPDPNRRLLMKLQNLVRNTLRCINCSWGHTVT